MAETTGISWADATFNPWVGCTKISPGCTHCYAADLVQGRMGRAGTWGPRGTRERTSPSNWRKPWAWNRESEAQGRVRYGGSPDERIRVFCASLADVFEPRPELVPWRDDLMTLVQALQHLDWLILTKRPDVARDWIDEHYGPRFPALFPNVWLGTSIESARYTYRADELRECRVALRFLSCEPLLGSLFPRRSSQAPAGLETPAADGYRSSEQGGPASGDSRPLDLTDPAGLPAGEDALEGSAPTRAAAPLDLTGISWVIVGGESGGKNARPMHPSWVREIRDAVRAAPETCPTCRGLGWFFDEDVTAPKHVCDCWPRTALHFKQWGSWRPGRGDAAGSSLTGDRRILRESILLDADGKRRDTNELHSFTLPDDWERMEYAGAAPTSGGKMLDGVDWCEHPPSPAADVTDRLFPTPA